MTTKENARWQAGAKVNCARDDITLTNEQRGLLAKLASITEMIEGYKATIFMLERERMQLQTALRLTGYRPPPRAEA